MRQTNPQTEGGSQSTWREPSGMLQEHANNCFSHFFFRTKCNTMNALDERMSSSMPILKVPYLTVFHEFHTAVRGPATLYLICIAPNPSVVLNFSCLKVTQALLRAVCFCACTFKCQRALSVSAYLPAMLPSLEDNASYTSDTMR